MFGKYNENIILIIIIQINILLNFIYCYIYILNKLIIQIIDYMFNNKIYSLFSNIFLRLTIPYTLNLLYILKI